MEKQHTVDKREAVARASMPACSRKLFNRNDG